MTGKGKRLTHLAIALGVLVLVGAAFALKRPIFEQWYLWQLESEDEETRELAAENLEKMCSVRSIPKLLEVFRRGRTPEDPFEDHYAMKAIVGIGSPGARTLVKVGLDRREDGTTRTDAACALAYIGPGIRGVLPDLVEGLKSEHEHEQWIAAFVLSQVRGGIGPEADLAVPGLIELLEEQNSNIASYAAVALGRSGAREAAPPLIKALGYEEGLRWSAIWALGELGPRAVEALPALTEMSKNVPAGGNLSNRIEEALGKIRGRDKSE